MNTSLYSSDPFLNPELLDDYNRSILNAADSIHDYTYNTIPLSELNYLLINDAVTALDDNYKIHSFKRKSFYEANKYIPIQNIDIPYIRSYLQEALISNNNAQASLNPDNYTYNDIKLTQLTLTQLVNAKSVSLNPLAIRERPFKFKRLGSRLFYPDIVAIQTFLDDLFNIKTVQVIEPTRQAVVTARARMMRSPQKTRTRSGGYYKRKYRKRRNSRNRRNKN
jgi:hypothetical protein